MMASGDLTGVRSLAHQIRGVGGMYGYPALTENAALIEESIVENQEAELVAELLEEFSLMVVQIKRGMDEQLLGA
jgi:HPt (histidine-containing phosphotransfer) domain-containing protein